MRQLKIMAGISERLLMFQLGQQLNDCVGPCGDFLLFLFLLHRVPVRREATTQQAKTTTKTVPLFLLTCTNSSAFTISSPTTRANEPGEATYSTTEVRSFFVMLQIR
jgi:hypothetical protein